MLISSLVTVKIAYALAKDMVNFEAAKRLAPNLIDSSRRWLLDTVQNQLDLSNKQTAGTNDEENKDKQDLVSTEYLVHNWLEAVFAWFQIIVLWHEPSVSISAVSGLLSSFLHVWPAIRVPPGRDREVEQRLDVDRWTYLHPQLMTLAELNQHACNLTKLGEKYFYDLLEYRQQKPVAFCSLLCSILLCTAFIGNQISGMSLVFTTLIAVMTGPGIYVHLLPEDCKLWLRSMAKRLFDCKIDESSTLAENEASPEEKANQPVSDEATSGTARKLLTSLSSTTKSIEQIFDSLRQRDTMSFRQKLYRKDSEPTPIQEGNEEADDASERTKLIDIPLGQTENSREDCRSRQNRRRSSDSSHEIDESVSLLESDEDQQDGFVML